MAFIRSSVVAAICLLGIVGVILADVCDQKMEEADKCGEPLQTASFINVCGTVINTALACLGNIDGKGCPKVQKIIQQATNIKQSCCDPATNIQKKCRLGQMISQMANFKYTDAQCKFTEEFWTCTSPFRKQLKSCSIDGVKEAMEKDVKNVIAELNSCKDHGYNITVDYPGTGTTFKSHPLLAIIIPVASTIILWLNKAY